MARSAWIGTLAAARRPGILRARFFSPNLGLRKRVGLYLSPDLVPGRPSPVVYLFRGHHDEWLNPREDASRRETLPEWVAREAARGGLPPLALVMPCMAADNRRFFASAVDWRSPHLAPPAPGLGIGAFESYLLRDVLERLEEALGLVARPRLAVGFSLGGLTAAQAALRNPGLFSAVATYGGSFFHAPPDETDSILMNPLFSPAFGTARPPREVRAHSPLALAATLPREAVAATRWFTRCGPEAAEPYGSNFYRVRAFLDALESRGVPNGTDPVDPLGRHDWRTADRFAMEFLKEALGSGGDPGRGLGKAATAGTRAPEENPGRNFSS